MKKFSIALIIIVAVALFGALTYYGFKHTRGVPVEVKEKKLPQIKAPYIEKEIDFKKGINVSFWETIPAKEIELTYQLMILPWPKKVVPSIKVKAFHNKKDIYFYIEWEDKTKDVTVRVKKFSDACAILFPLKEDIQPESLMMGFLGGANIWQWKASQDREYWQKKGSEEKAYADFHYPFEEKELFPVSKEKILSAVNDLLAIRPGTITSKAVQIVEGRGIYDNGKWKVVFRRRLRTDDETAAQFMKGKKLIAFAVWNGSKGDRGGRKSISDWVELVIE